MRRPAISGLPPLLALMAASGILSGCTSTYGTGEAPEMALFREMTGGFLSNEEKAPIQYQPRVPLVAPPVGEQLPQPAEVAEAADPNWPVDPDQRVALSRFDDDDNPTNDINQAEYRRLKPLAGAMSEMRRDNSTAIHENIQPAYDIVHQKQEREEFRKAVADAEGFGRSERRYLTDPPTEYRAPAATAPTTDFEEKKSSGNFITRWFRRK